MCRWKQFKCIVIEAITIQNIVVQFAILIMVKPFKKKRKGGRCSFLDRISKAFQTGFWRNLQSDELIKDTTETRK